MKGLVPLLERLARALLPADAFRDAMLGDLAERYRMERRRLGERTAARRHARRLLQAMAALTLQRVRRWWRGNDAGHGGPGASPKAGALSVFRSDLAHATTALIRRPIPALLAVATMALAIGPASAVFTIADTVLLRPLPYPEPERLVHVWSANPESGGGFPGGPRMAVQMLRSRTDSFERVEAYEAEFRLLSELGEPSEVGVTVVTPGLLSMLGVRPALGRNLTGVDPDERVAVISHGLWRQRLGGSEEALGSEILLDEQPYRVIGVAPAWLRFPDGDMAAWVPMPTDFDAPRVLIAARLATEPEDPALGVALDVVAEELRDAGALSEELGLEVRSFQDWREFLAGAPEQALWILLWAVGFVVVLASANLAHLRLTDVLDRQRQIAVAAALGAGRGRLLRQLLLENVMLAIVGGGAGILLAGILVDRAVALGPDNLRFLHDYAIGVDARVLAVVLAVTVVAGLAGGLAPALRGSSVSPASMLAAGGRTSTGSRGQQRLRAALVLAEVAISTFLLVGSGLLVKSFVQLQRVDPGVRMDGLVVAEVTLGPALYPDTTRKVQALEQLAGALEALPGVQRAAVGNGVPPRLASLRFLRFAEVEGGAPEDAQRARDFTSVSHVSPDYFDTLDLQPLRGRLLRPGDEPSSVVISETLARRLWPGGGAVGSRFRFGSRSDWLTVVGVVPDVRQSGYDEAADKPEAYRPLGAIQEHHRFFQIALHAPGRSDSLVGEIRERIRALAPELPIDRIATMRELYAADLASQRFNLMVMSGLAGVGALLAVLGLYGVVSYGVGRAVRELGIRMALGAAPSRVFRRVLMRGTGLAAVGVAAGILAGWWLFRYLESMLFGISARDAGVFAAVAVGSLLVALLASGLPARRATRVDPVETLRRE